MDCLRHDPWASCSLECVPAAACTEVLLTLLQDIAYSSDRSFADQQRSEGGSNLDWELEVRCHYHSSSLHCILTLTGPEYAAGDTCDA